MDLRNGDIFLFYFHDCIIVKEVHKNMKVLKFSMYIPNFVHNFVLAMHNVWVLASTW